jgi:MYXO-CTERM domain-containing protein
MVVVLAVALPAVAEATYSIAAVDRDSGQVGGTGASCVGGMAVRIIYGPAPGKGVVHAQAWVNTAARDEAVRLLEQNAAPADVIAAITAPAFDGQAGLRQYGVVDLAGRAAGFTGADTLAHAEDRQGQHGAFAYSAQGNILTSPAVLDQAVAAFEGDGCDLADRLMRALEAGADGGEGDSRCTPDIPVDAAFLEVAAADGTALVRLEVGEGGVDPLPEMRRQYDAWRQIHPCPAPPDAGPGDGDGDDSGGCGCRGSAGPASGAALVLVLLAAARLTRRRTGVTSRLF